MNKRITVTLAVIAAIVMFMTGVLSARPNEAHDFSGKCETCHLTSPRKGNKNIFTMDIVSSNQASSCSRSGAS